MRHGLVPGSPLRPSPLPILPRQPVRLRDEGLQAVLAAMVTVECMDGAWLGDIKAGDGGGEEAIAHSVLHAPAPAPPPAPAFAHIPAPATPTAPAPGPAPAPASALAPALAPAPAPAPAQLHVNSSVAEPTVGVQLEAMGDAELVKPEPTAYSLGSATSAPAVFSRNGQCVCHSQHLVLAPAACTNPLAFALQQLSLHAGTTQPGAAHWCIGLGYKVRLGADLDML